MDDKKTTTTGKEKTVEVKEAQLNKILGELETLKKTVSKQRYKEANEELKEKALQQGHCKRLDGEVIIGWYPMAKTGKGLCDIVYNETGEEIKLKEEDTKAKMEIIYNNNMPIGETLKGHYKTIKGKDIVCDAKNFYRSTTIEKFDVLREEGDYKIIKFHNTLLPQEYKINNKFINA